MGIEKEARPAPRLLRKFSEFQQRFSQRPDDNNEPSSPALPTVRPALAAKIDPYAAAAPRDPQAPRPNSGVGGSTTKSGRQKLTIFSDADSAAPAVTAGPDTKGWENIGSLADRKKENMIEPKPWVGETLKAGGKKSSTKIPVFKDEVRSIFLVLFMQILMITGLMIVGYGVLYSVFTSFRLSSSYRSCSTTSDRESKRTNRTYFCEP